MYRLTIEAMTAFQNFIEDRNLWVTSEAVEEAKKRGHRYAGEIPTPFENLGFASYEAYFTYELLVPHHTMSKRIADDNGGVIDIRAYNRWLREESEEPEHQHLAKYM